MNNSGPITPADTGNDSETKSTRPRLEETIRATLLSPESGLVARLPDICLEDIKADWVIQQLLDLARALRRLRGRFVEDVRWVNTPSPIYNPRGTIGHFEITLKG